MMSRFPSLSRLVLFGAAGLGVLLLIPADSNTPPVSSLTVGNSQPAAVAAASTVPAAPGGTALAAAKPVLPELQPAATEQKPVTTVASIDPADVAPLDVEPEPEGERMWVGNTALNVRAGPSASTAKLAVLRPGAAVSVLETAGNWVFVRDESGESGWVYSRYLAGQAGGAAPADNPTVANASTGEESVRRPTKEFGRIGDAVMLRAGPSRSAPELFVLRPGERVAVAEKRGRWVRVIMESGISAWVDARDLSR